LAMFTLICAYMHWPTTAYTAYAGIEIWDRPASCMLHVSTCFISI